MSTTGHSVAPQPEDTAAPLARETASEVIADFLDPFIPGDRSAYKVGLDLHRYLRERGWEIKPAKARSQAGDERG